VDPAFGPRIADNARWMASLGFPGRTYNFLILDLEVGPARFDSRRDARTLDPGARALVVAIGPRIVAAGPEVSALHLRVLALGLRVGASAFAKST
jgi:hypothetical protein